MKLYPVLLLLSTVNVVLGQEYVKVYMHEHGFPTNQSIASTYRLVSTTPENPDLFSVNEFYLDHTVKSSATYSDVELYSKEGLFTSFYKNGQKKEEGYYVNNSRNGKWTLWHPNGQVSEERHYFVVDRGRFRLEKAWDSLGTQTINGGAGTHVIYDEEDSGIAYQAGMIKDGYKEGKWVGYFKNSDIAFEEFYEKSDLKKGISYDSARNEYHYKEDLFIDIEKFYRFAGKNLVYPHDARKKRIEGRVVAQLVIDPDGNHVYTGIYKSSGFGFDEEVMKLLIKYDGQWGKLLHRGQHVKKPVPISIPISFMPPK